MAALVLLDFSVPPPELLEAPESDELEASEPFWVFPEVSDLPPPLL